MICTEACLLLCVFVLFLFLLMLSNLIELLLLLSLVILRQLAMSARWTPFLCVSGTTTDDRAPSAQLHPLTKATLAGSAVRQTDRHT